MQGIGSKDTSQIWPMEPYQLACSAAHWYLSGSTCTNSASWMSLVHGMQRWSGHAPCAAYGATLGCTLHAVPAPRCSLHAVPTPGSLRCKLNVVPALGQPYTLDLAYGTNLQAQSGSLTAPT